MRAFDQQLSLPLENPENEQRLGKPTDVNSNQASLLMQQVLDRTNLIRALKQVTRNKGAPGIDGVTVEQLPEYLKHHWGNIKQQLLNGTYKPQPVKRVEIPKLEKKLKLKVNTEKNAVDKVWNRTFLGFAIGKKGKRIKVSQKAERNLKQKVLTICRRTRGHAFIKIIEELRESLLGWKAYFDISEVLSSLKDLDKWIRRKLRCYLWKQWGRSGYRRLRQFGIDRFLA